MAHVALVAPRGVPSRAIEGPALCTRTWFGSSTRSQTMEETPRSVGQARLHGLRGKTGDVLVESWSEPAMKLTGGV